MTGSGTRQDPYILTTWQELIASREENTYSEWHGGDLDFNDIQPSGFTSRITIYGGIDFKNATFKNFRMIYSGSESCVVFRSLIDGGIFNLNFLNFYITKTQVNLGQEIFYFLWRGNGVPRNNLKFSGRIDMNGRASSNIEVPIFRFVNNESGYYAGINGLSANIEGVVNGTTDYSISLPLFSGPNASAIAYGTTPYVKNSDVTINMDCTYNSNTVPVIINATMQNCRVEGKVTHNGNTGGQIMYSNYSNGGGNVFLLEGNGYYIFQGNVSVYDSSKMSLESGSSECVKGCTSSQINSPSYLHSIGFPIGVN
jgi:hypothetical protein